MDADADELLSYIVWKKNKRWTWYAVEIKTGVILAWHNGRRTDESCSLLMAKLFAFPAIRYYTDDWHSYRKYIQPSEHIVGKADTWRIERKNLNRNVYQPLLFLERSILGKYLINGFNPAPFFVARRCHALKGLTPNFSSE